MTVTPLIWGPESQNNECYQFTHTQFRILGQALLHKGPSQNVQNLGTCPELSNPSHHLGTQKFRNILLFEDPPLDEFGNIDFGITHCFDSQGPKLGG